ncbi:MAG: hypothetical protein PHG25_03195 [Candidatus Pacebacteria bacterium]|nr:hypothetical protein [Candidatus Paceibacterota bacterium]
MRTFKRFVTAFILLLPSWKKTEPSYGTFGNIYTGSISVIIGALFLTGILCAWAGSFWSILLVPVALTMMAAGWTTLGFVKEKGEKDTSEKTAKKAAFLTWFGKRLVWRGHTVVLENSTIVAPYLGIKANLVDMTPKEMTFEVNVVSHDNIQAPLTAVMIATPSKNYLDKFIEFSNGTWGKIEDDFKGIISELVEAITPDHPMVAIARNGNIVSKPIWEKMCTSEIESKYGVKTSSIRVICLLPASVAQKYEEIVKAGLESQARAKTVDGLYESAKKLLDLAHAHGEKLTPSEAHKQAMSAALLEDERIERRQIEILGPVGSNYNLILGAGELGDKPKK